MKSEDNISIFKDQFGSPTSAEFLSKIILLIIKKYKKYNKGKFLYGIYNVVSNGNTSWYMGLLKQFYIIIIIFLMTK